MNRLPTAVILALLAAPALAETAPQAPPPQAGYVVVAPQPVRDETSYTGHIAAVGVVHIQARVTGYLEAQDFTDGAYVTKGQTLYEIERPPYQAALDQAQAALAQAQAQEALAQITLARAKALLHAAAGTQATLDQAEATQQTDHAAVLAAQAQVETARINLGYTTITAPISGLTGATNVTPGNVVGPSSGTLVTLVTQDPIYVDFALPDADALTLQTHVSGLDVVLTLPDGTTYAPVGKIDFTGNQVDESTDTQAWRATIANPGHTLKDGEFVRVTLRDRTAKPAIVIPLAALGTDQIGTYVLVIGPGNKIIRRNVTLGPQTNTSAQILSGLQPGDRLVVAGLQSLHPGLVVTPYQAAP
ncbi:efflux RND transporter periplasmic adaptor subunit [Acidocella sp.]|uniref:efflux RND transporter periplasmic adaptor subunit n=1 Tax=Acidocella sp. TaxID=50710 RepID=UPI0026391876|nr:efflux RND transporter periplasmic adaptor subunit [Acidocella sp.]